MNEPVRLDISPVALADDGKPLTKAGRCSGWPCNIPSGTANFASETSFIE